MVLTEETPESATFRFKGNRWALATLLPGLLLLVLVGNRYRLGHPLDWLLGVVGLFGGLLVYSSIYSVTAEQWLVAGGPQRTIRFHKKNLYGLVAWERPAQDFRAIRVGRHLRSSNWQITLVCADGFELALGDHAFGAFTQEGALNLATQVGRRTGIPVECSQA
jgi:hypothetical protein